MEDAPRVAGNPVMPLSFIISFAWSFEASMPMLSAMARTAVVLAPDEQAADAILSHDVRQRVHDAGVVAALRRGERAVGLHADER